MKMNNIYIIGISAFYHDSAACLIKNGEIVAAAQEERFTRKKQDKSFPINSIKYCLNHEDIKIDDIDYISFYEKPLLKFDRLIKTYLSYAPFGFKSFEKAMRSWFGEKLHIKKIIKNELNYKGQIIFPEHHESHASSAFFASPFEKAAFLTMDGVGEWATASYGTGKLNKIQIMGDICFPHSLGMLYSAFTSYIGFKVNSGEYKVMGLAPYGQPKFKKLIYEYLIDVKDDGSFRMNMDYFDYCSGSTMTNSKFDKIFGSSPRKSETTITQRHMDLAKSIQEVTEEIVLKIAKHVRKVTGMKRLCLAGGVALNCVANGKLLRSGIFDEIWIQPAAGDAGGAVGSALYTWYQHLNNPRNSDNKIDFMKGTLLGPEFKNDYIKLFLEKNNYSYRLLKNEEVSDKIADLIADENIIGWFQGRMEFGPRALGSRTIIGDARSSKMQKTLNLKIKYRESFRPFAPSIRIENISDYFEINCPSPYMLLVADLKKNKQNKMSNKQKSYFGLEKLNLIRSEVPAITHVDYSARIHSVDKKVNPLYHAMLSKFNDKFGCPLVVNTSFNVRGEPIVCSPEDAYRCFMRTEMDYLILGNYLLDKKSQQKLTSDSDWKNEFELD